MKRLVVLAMVALLSLATATATLAAGQTVTANVKVTVPGVNKTIMGAIVVKNSGTADNISAVWTFIGTVDGQAASAKGLAEGRFTGTGYEGQLTKVETWDMLGLPKIGIPTPLSLQSGTDQAIVGSVKTKMFGDISAPLAVQGVEKMIAPFSGDLTLSVTNQTAQPVLTLPRTGAGSHAIDLPMLALLGAIGITLTLTTVGRRAASAR